MCVEVVCSAPSLCSHQLTHQSVIMAQLVPNSWTTIGESGFIIRLRGAGNWGLEGAGGSVEENKGNTASK